ncbi:hypothetical protein KPA93_11715 [Burkholderia cenocepacia]|uniref:hypothetical protein n=1 Tax=Burkholderia cenocepacia TaxID=95486 RepID=UPI00286257F5|nr:hypothetical protein [Burkholderia cenocepacia]MDR8030710.1 hypothetical protein [Burkholderia cenocepacia]MDR8041150.1 hypothetical protein [Burkholderia cenocepacia]
MFVVGGFNRPRTEIERLSAAHRLSGPVARVGVHAPDKMLAHASVFTLSRYAGLRIGVACDRYEVALLQRFFNVFLRARLIATATGVR